MNESIPVQISTFKGNELDLEIPTGPTLTSSSQYIGPVPGFNVIRRAQIRKTSCLFLRGCGRFFFKSISYTTGGFVILFLLITIGLVYVNDTEMGDLWNAYHRIIIYEEMDNNDIIALQADSDFLKFKFQLIEDYLKQQNEKDFNNFIKHYQTDGKEEEVDIRFPSSNMDMNDE